MSAEGILRVYKLSMKLQEETIARLKEEIKTRQTALDFLEQSLAKEKEYYESIK